MNSSFITSSTDNFADCSNVVKYRNGFMGCVRPDMDPNGQSEGILKRVVFNVK